MHDESIAEVPEPGAEQTRRLVEQIMVASMREIVDSAIATHWK